MKTITERERQLINAVVAEGLTSLPAGALEKDLVITQALRGLAEAGTLDFPLVFCGGTCLSKAHGLIQRMSEDLDFKILVPADLSRSALDRRLSQFKKYLITHFSNAGFHIPAKEVMARDGNRYFSLMLHFESAFPKVASLRTEIQVEFTERPVSLATHLLPIRSLLAVLANLPDQVFAMTCIGVEETLTEKILSLLRRTAEFLAGRHRGDYDSRLVRHLYDVHEILREYPHIASELSAALFSELVAADARQFGNQYPEFATNPNREMAIALAALKTDSRFRAFYASFLDDLVYGEAVDFAAAISAFERVAARVLADPP